MVGCLNLSSRYHILDLYIFSCYLKLFCRYSKSALNYLFKLLNCSSQWFCLSLKLLVYWRALLVDLFNFFIYYSFYFTILAILNINLWVYSFYLFATFFSVASFIIYFYIVYFTFWICYVYLWYLSISLTIECFCYSHYFLIFVIFSSAYFTL